MPGWVSPWELSVLIGFLVLLGPRRLPEIARSLGKERREFKDSRAAKDEPKRQDVAAIPPAPRVHEPVASRLLASRTRPPS